MSAHPPRFRTCIASNALCQHALDPHYRDMARMRARTGPEVDRAFAVVKKFIAAHPAEEIYRGAQERKFPWGIIRSPEETLEDPHFSEDRAFFAQVEHPELGETYTYAGRPYIANGTPWRTFRSPLLGEHNARVYGGELGMSEDDLARLAAEGVV